MRCCYHLLPGLAGVRVSKVKPGSPTSRAKNLMIGDVLLEINDVVLFSVDKGIRKWFQHADVIGVRTSLPTYLSLSLSLSLFQFLLLICSEKRCHLHVWGVAWYAD